MGLIEETMFAGLLAVSFFASILRSESAGPGGSTWFSRAIRADPAPRRPIRPPLRPVSTYTPQDDLDMGTPLPIPVPKGVRSAEDLDMGTPLPISGKGGVRSAKDLKKPTSGGPKGVLGEPKSILKKNSSEGYSEIGISAKDNDCLYRAIATAFVIEEHMNGGEPAPSDISEEMKKAAEAKIQDVKTMVVDFVDGLTREKISKTLEFHYDKFDEEEIKLNNSFEENVGKFKKVFRQSVNNTKMASGTEAGFVLGWFRHFLKEKDSSIYPGFTSNTTTSIDEASTEKPGNNIFIVKTPDHYSIVIRDSGSPLKISCS